MGSDVKQWEIQVGEPGAGDICQWITDKGGPNNLTSLDIFDLVSSYVSQQPISGYDFIPTSLQILGCVQYYLGDIIGGNQNTGCDF